MKLLIDCELIFDGKELCGPASVLIDGEIIVSIDKRDEFKDIVVDKKLACKFLMPGLIDMHVHIGGYKEGMPSGNPFLPMKNFLKLMIYNGITTVRDVGNSIENILYLKRWVEKYHGPSIYSSGPILDKPPLIWANSRMIRTPEEAAFEVDRLAIEQVDLIKVYKGITEDILKTVISQAERHNLKVAGHLENTDIITAVRLGIYSLEHIFTLINESYIAATERDRLPIDFKRRLYIWKAVDLKSEKIKVLIEILQRHNIYICPTILVLKRTSVIEEMFGAPYLEYMANIMPYHKYFKHMNNPIARLFSRKYIKKYLPISPLKREERQIFNEGFNKIFEFTKQLINNGINIVVGSDTPNPSVTPGFSLHEELKLLVKEAGISSTRLLTSATSIAAKALNNNSIGEIKRGYIANLLMINDNPIEDIENLSKIDAVILKGQIITAEELQRLLHQVLKD